MYRWCSCFWRQWNFEDRESEKTATQKWCKKCSSHWKAFFVIMSLLACFSPNSCFQFASSTWISTRPLVQTRHSAEADYLVDLLFDLIQPFVQRSLVRCFRSFGSQRNRIEAQPPHTQNVVQLQIDTMESSDCSLIAYSTHPLAVAAHFFRQGCWSGQQIGNGFLLVLDDFFNFLNLSLQVECWHSREDKVCYAL